MKRRPTNDCRSGARTRSRTRSTVHPARLERGVVLFIALIAMVAMSLAAAAVVRSMDTTVALIGNLVLRQASIAAADAGVEQALGSIYDRALIPERDSDASLQSYYATRRPGEDARGVPLLLRRVSDYPSGAPIVDAGGNNRIRYVVERLCANTGAATVVHCNMTAPDAPSPQSSPAQPAPPIYAVLRITARVDGPQNTVSFVQTLVRDSTPPKRLAWRLID